jgi:cell division protein ZapE
VHERIAHARKSVDGDPLPSVAKAIAADARLLCFDELHVTDIADAMILGRLFAGMFEAGIVVVATSNSAPQDLYRNGLNRQLFVPFIAEIERRMRVLELAAAKDYRLEKLAGQPLYFVPPGPAAAADVGRLWHSLTNGATGSSTTLEVKGRKVFVPSAAMGVARFAFSDLCEKPLGSLDYLQIAHAFHTIIIEHIPILGPSRRNEARRFINLIDTLYDNRICLIATAEAEPEGLYPEGDGADLFVRTASRLTEMRSEAYLADRAMRRSGLAGPSGLAV